MYVVSESGTVRPLELVDTSEATALLPGGSIILLSSQHTNKMKCDVASWLVATKYLPPSTSGGYS